ncbi:MAG: hypothetical protein ACLQA5_21430 [Solirubrobacteraceae bacterium]
MRLGGVNPGDIVLADVKGRRFYATVTGRHERALEVEPIDRRVTYRRVKAREAVGIWRKSRSRTPTVRGHGVSPNGVWSGPETAGTEAT